MEASTVFSKDSRFVYWQKLGLGRAANEQLA